MFRRSSTLDDNPSSPNIEGVHPVGEVTHPLQVSNLFGMSMQSMIESSNPMSFPPREMVITSYFWPAGPSLVAHERGRRKSLAHEGVFSLSAGGLPLPAASGFVVRSGRVDVSPSASKHGVALDDIEHALRNAVAIRAKYRRLLPGG